MDKYMGFEYNGIKVNKTGYADFTGFIVNGGDDLAFPSLPSFSNEFAFSKFSDSSYFLGTTKENREINLSIMLESISLKEYRGFLARIWNTNPNSQNILKFDYNEFFGYSAKLNSISEGKFVVESTCYDQSTPYEKYNIELELSFITYGDWAAQYIGNPYILMSGVTEILDTFIFTPNENKLQIENRGSLPIYLKMDLYINFPPFKIFTSTNGGDSKLWIEKEDSSPSLSIFTKFGILWDNDKNRFTDATTNNGPIEINPGSTVVIEFYSSSPSENIRMEDIFVEAVLREII